MYRYRGTAKCCSRVNASSLKKENPRSRRSGRGTESFRLTRLIDQLCLTQRFAEIQTIPMDLDLDRTDSENASKGVIEQKI